MSNKPKKTERQTIEERKPIPVAGVQCFHCHSVDIYEVDRNDKGVVALKCHGCGRSWPHQIA